MSSKDKRPKKIDLKKSEKPLQRYAKSLAVELTPEESELRSKEAGRVFRQKEKLESEKSIFNEDINAKIKTKDTRLKQLLSAMDSGFEDREIKVSIVPDFTTGRAYTVREDTGDVIEDRPLAADERETSIEGTEGEGTDAKDGDTAKPAKGRKIERKKKPKADEADAGTPPDDGAPPADDAE